MGPAEEVVPMYVEAADPPEKESVEEDEAGPEADFPPVAGEG
jgi:hypothetical protein